MLQYYSKLVKSSKAAQKEIFQLKTRELYDKLRNCYPDLSKQDDCLKSIVIYEDQPSYFHMKRCINAIVEAGYPHHVLIYCCRSLIDNWSIPRIISDLSPKSLDFLFNAFINEYSVQSGLPLFLINMYFINLREKLNKKFKNLISDHDSVTPQKMEKYMNWITGWTQLDFYYGKDRDHDISDWCNKVKNKTVLSLIK